MKTLLILVSVLCTAPVFAQPYAIGHTTITFNDPARTGGFGSGGGSGRQIQSEIYYPATIAGDDVAAAMGDFPVIVFGHGFVMSWDAYQNIWDELVPQGYIMVFPRTEGGFSPSHSEFGLDLALLVTKMQEQNSEPASIFESHVAPKSAIMGHSMGGGASFLAAASNTSIETVIGLAPAETNPSAVAAAALVTVPALIFSGSSDAVTPPVDHHLPIYNSIASNCKNFVSIIGGAHCYFANSNFNCDFGEGSSGGSITITRAEQHQILFDIVTPWLNFKLKGMCDAGSEFNQLLDNDTRIVATKECTGSSAPINTAISSNGNTLTSASTTASYQWLDCNNNYALINGETNSSITPPAGNYAVQLTENGCVDTSECVLVSVTDLYENPLNQARVYPNPSSGMVNIHVPFEGRFVLYDLSGKRVSEIELNLGENTVHVSSLKGFFLYEVHTESRTIQGKIMFE